MKNVLIVGLGRFGRLAAAALTKRGHQVLGIDNREKSVNAALPFLTSAQIGDCTDPQFIKGLGVSNFDLCIVAIGDNFQSSLETTSLLKEYGAPLVVSRASREVHSRFLLRNGADHVVYPEKQMAEWTAICYSSDMISDYMALSEDFAIVDVEIPESWVGKAVNQLDIRRKYGINIIGIKKGNAIIPSVDPEMVFDAGQHVLVLGRSDKLSKCFKF